VEPLTPEAIASLDPTSIWGVDRWVTRNFSPWAAEFSDNFLFSSYALPLTLLLDQPSRKDFGKVGLFTLESLIVNNGITNLTKVLAKRIRPFVYNPNIPLPMKVSKKARYSFFSGHASNTACMYFLTASMFSDFYPDSDLRPFVWTTAIVVPAFTGYLRMRAGKHFLSDVVVGYLVGAAVGMIIPALHK
jgi:membrane-associated phospholipid phosphatase